MAALVARNAVAEPAAQQVIIDLASPPLAMSWRRRVTILSEHGDVDETILVVNAGPSIIKFAAWPAGDP